MSEGNHEAANGRVNVLVANDFSDRLIAQIQAVSPRLHVERQFPNVSDKAWANVEVLYSAGGKLPEPHQSPNLRWIQLHSAGIDHMATHPIWQRPDLIVTTSSGIHAVQMAEFSLTMMLAFTYRLPLVLEQQARADWKTSDDGRELFAPRQLRGQTLGIAGYGSIGRELARIADAMGMTVLATKRDLMNLADDEGYAEPGTGDPTGEIPARLYPPEALASMASECDYLVITLPLTDDTRQTVNKAVLGAMKPTAVLVNVGRGGVVDEAALIEALQKGRIAGAALDVFEQEPLPTTSPLWAMENVIISPHISGTSAYYHEKAAALFAENLSRYLEGQPLLNQVRHGY